METETRRVKHALGRPREATTRLDGGPHPRTTSHPWHRGIPLLLAAFALLAGCANFHAVIPDEVYRSGQVSAKSLRDLVLAHDIRAVVNLRGYDPDPWYTEEQAMCVALEVEHVDCRLSSRRTPLKREVLHLLDLFDRLHGPILLHCLGGADRSGFAAACYLLHKRNATVDEALAQLSLLPYGHLPWGKTQALDRYLDEYARTGSGRSFRDWVAARPDDVREIDAARSP